MDANLIHVPTKRLLAEAKNALTKFKKEIKSCDLSEVRNCKYHRELALDDEFNRAHKKAVRIQHIVQAGIRRGLFMTHTSAHLKEISDIRDVSDRLLESQTHALEESLLQLVEDFERHPLSYKFKIPRTNYCIKPYPEIDPVEIVNEECQIGALPETLRDRVRLGADVVFSGAELDDNWTPREKLVILLYCQMDRLVQRCYEVFEENYLELLGILGDRENTVFITESDSGTQNG